MPRSRRRPSSGRSTNAVRTVRLRVRQRRGVPEQTARIVNVDVGASAIGLGRASMPETVTVRRTVASPPPGERRHRHRPTLLGVTATRSIERHPWNAEFTWADHAGPFHRITQEQADEFDRDGFIVLHDVFSDDELAPR